MVVWKDQLIFIYSYTLIDVFRGIQEIIRSGEEST